MADEKPAPHTAPAAGNPTPKAERKAAKKSSPRAVGARKPAAMVKKPARKPRRATRRVNGAGGRRTADVTSKADLIRKVAGIIKAKGQKPRPADIVRILGEEGVEVSAAQVSQTLKAAGYRPLRKRRRGRKNASAKRPGGRAGAGSQPISVEDLLAAKSVSGAFGGTDQAIAVLQALKRIER